MLTIFALGVAHAGSLDFTPDRPGVGDSTGTVGTAHAMVEGGLALTPSPLAFGTSSVIVRYGIDDAVELRLRAPDITWTDPDIVVGPLGLGGKVGGSLSERWSVSVVPELLLDPATGDLAGSFGGNLALNLDPVGLWGHSTASAAPGATSWLVGGGASVGFSTGGLYANAGHTFGSTTFAGGGGWWALGDTLQLDAGCDVVLGPDPLPIFGLGLSTGW